MIPRHLETALKLAARKYPVVAVTGPRQSGKTTLVRAAFADRPYVSLEDPEQRDFARRDPKGFLGRFRDRVVLDEVQRVPDLLSYIQGLVDERKVPGRFLLTGSQNFLLLERISQTLAGRCSMLHLLPFSRSELAGEEMMDLSRLGRVPPEGRRPSVGLFEMLLRGGYPPIHDLELEPSDWLRNYYQAYVERDVRDLLNVGDLETFGRFVRLCAGRCGQLLNVSALAADCGVAHTTARRWLSTLEASYIVMLLRPFHRNFRKRLVKSPKLHFLDSGLLCYLLRIRTSDDLRLHAARGAVFESWAVSEVVKNFAHRGRDSDVAFWRDSAGHEVDLIVEAQPTPAAVEMKSGETFQSDFLDGLKFWRGLTGRPDAPASVVYGGGESYMREGMAVVSWNRWG